MLQECVTAVLVAVSVAGLFYHHVSTLRLAAVTSAMPALCDRCATACGARSPYRGTMLCKACWNVAPGALAESVARARSLAWHSLVVKRNG